MPNLEDIKTIITAYEWTEKGAVQFYVASRRADFDKLIGELDEHFKFDQYIQHEIKRQNCGGIDSLCIIGATALISVYGFADSRIVAHGLNQNIHYLLKEKDMKVLIAFHIDKESLEYREALASAQGSQFKEGVFEI